MAKKYSFKVYADRFYTRFWHHFLDSKIIDQKTFSRYIMFEFAEFPIFKCLRSCNKHLYQKRSNSDFPSDISGVCSKYCQK